MTRASPDYDDDELTVRSVRERKTTMRLGEKAILSAVGVILSEERDAREKYAAEMLATIAALQARIEALERVMPASRLRAIGGE